MPTKDIRMLYKMETGEYPGQIKSVLPEVLENATRIGLLNYIYWLEEKYDEVTEDVKKLK